MCSLQPQLHFPQCVSYFPPRAAHFPQSTFCNNHMPHIAPSSKASSMFLVQSANTSVCLTYSPIEFRLRTTTASLSRHIFYDAAHDSTCEAWDACTDQDTTLVLCRWRCTSMGPGRSLVLPTAQTVPRRFPHDRWTWMGWCLGPVQKNACTPAHFSSSRRHRNPHGHSGCPTATLGGGDCVQCPCDVWMNGLVHHNHSSSTIILSSAPSSTSPRRQRCPQESP